MGVESNVSAVYKMILLQIYPVGTIYESLSNNDPNEFIGGKWVKLGEGRMFITAGTNNSDYYIGMKGGESEHTLVESEIPSHNHMVGLKPHYAKYTDSFIDTAGIYYEYDKSESVNTNTSGNNIPHENMPPYVVASAWERLE